MREEPGEWEGGKEGEGDRETHARESTRAHALPNARMHLFVVLYTRSLMSVINVDADQKALPRLPSHGDSAFCTINALPALRPIVRRVARGRHAEGTDFFDRGWCLLFFVLFRQGDEFYSGLVLQKRCAKTPCILETC